MLDEQEQVRPWQHRLRDMSAKVRHLQKSPQGRAIINGLEPRWGNSLWVNRRPVERSVNGCGSPVPP